IWDQWSKQSDLYKQGECEERWQGFSDDRPKSERLGIGSLIEWAKADGGEKFGEVWEQYKADKRIERVAARATEILQTEYGNAQRLVALYGHKMLFDRDRNIWVAWTGTHWREGADIEVERFAKASAKQMH